jgi:hypothetical protein
MEIIYKIIFRDQVKEPGFGYTECPIKREAEVLQFRESR